MRRSPSARPLLARAVAVAVALAAVVAASPSPQQPIAFRVPSADPAVRVPVGMATVPFPGQVANQPSPNMPNPNASSPDQKTPKPSASPPDSASPSNSASPASPTSPPDSLLPAPAAPLDTIVHSGTVMAGCDVDQTNACHDHFIQVCVRAPVEPARQLTAAA